MSQTNKFNCAFLGLHSSFINLIESDRKRVKLAHVLLFFIEADIKIPM